MENFYKRLKHLRTINHLTQLELANMLNIERSTLSSYETGRRYPTLVILIRIADVFDVSVDYLIGREKNNIRVTTDAQDSERNDLYIKKN